MKKRIALILTSLVLCFSLIGCAYEGEKNYTVHTGLIEIKGRDNLYYDPQTRIVYIIFNEQLGYAGFGYMSVYYASNGLPYTYDIENDKLVEIEYGMENES